MRRVSLPRQALHLSQQWPNSELSNRPAKRPKGLKYDIRYDITLECRHVIIFRPPIPHMHDPLWCIRCRSYFDVIAIDKVRIKLETPEYEQGEFRFTL